MSDGAVIKARGLSKSFSEGVTAIDILKNIQLDVYPGEMVAIVGNSGSGKSTLLQLLGGLDDVTQGQVFIKNQLLSGMRESEKCRLRNESLGFIYQFHHLLPEFTALENVCMPLLLGKTDVKSATTTAIELLKQVGLAERVTHKIGELSGGERQRVAIARALVGNPACILADEPTGNLDPRNAERVFDMFVNLQQTQQCAVVVVTHDLELAKRAQRVLHLVDGNLVSSL